MLASGFVVTASAAAANSSGWGGDGGGAADPASDSGSDPAPASRKFNSRHVAKILGDGGPDPTDHESVSPVDAEKEWDSGSGIGPRL